MKIDLTRVITIDYLIRKKATGSPGKLAQRLDISKRTLFFTLNFMKNSLEAPINYNRFRETYYYDEEGTLCFTFQKETSSEFKSIVKEVSSMTVLIYLFDIQFLLLQLPTIK